MSSEGFAARGSCSWQPPASAAANKQFSNDCASSQLNWYAAETGFPSRPIMAPAPSPLNALFSSNSLKANHSWYNFYQQFPVLPDAAEKNPVVRAANTKTLKAITMFRMTSDKVWRYQNDPVPGRGNDMKSKMMVFETMKTTSEVDPDANTALFVIVKIDGDTATLRAVHKELAGADRPDLHLIELNRYSVDLLNDRALHLKNYVIGDVLEVIDLVRRSKRNPETMKGHFEKDKDVPNPSFWRAGKFRLLEREILLNQPLFVGFKPSEKVFVCVAEGLDKPVVIHEKKKDIMPGTWFISDIFIPAIQPGRLLNSIHPGHEGDVLKATEMIAETPLFPIVIRRRAFPMEEKWKIERALNAFQSPEESSYKSGCEALSFSLRMRLSGILAMENLIRQPGRHAAVIHKCHPTTEDRILLCLEVCGPNVDPSCWENDTTFTIETPCGSSFQAQVHKTIYVRLGMYMEAIVKQFEYQSRDIVIHQPFYKSGELDFLPTTQELQGLPSGCNGRKILEALNGGNQIFGCFPPPCTPISIGDVEMQYEDCRYIEAVYLNECPAFRRNTEEGYFTIAAAATRVIRRKARKIQLIICPNQKEVTIAVQALKHPEYFFKSFEILRLTPEKHHRELINWDSSSSDLPERMIEVLQEFVLDAEKRLLSDKTVILVNLLGDCLHHLQAWYALPCISYGILSLKSEKEPTRSIYEIFLEIASPRLIVATPDTAIHFVRKYGLDVKEVAMVQVARTRLIPRYSIISLVATFWNARFAFVNCIDDRRPDCPKYLPRQLVGYAVKDIFYNKADDSIPCLN